MSFAEVRRALQTLEAHGIPATEILKGQSDKRCKVTCKSPKRWWGEVLAFSLNGRRVEVVVGENGKVDDLEMSL